MTTIGFIGFGNMAKALYQGAVAKKTILPQSVYFTETNKQKAEDIAADLGLQHVDLTTLTNNCDVIVIAIKPQGLAALIETLPKLKETQCVVSILAGIKMAEFEQKLGNIQMCRVMPNTPALLGYGMAALSFNNRVSKPLRQFISSFFKGTGKTIECNEASLDAVTGISGSGPAYFYKIADAIALIGKQEGLSYQDAITLTAQTMIGAGHMLLETGKLPVDLIKDVSSPNGTTEAGLNALDASALLPDIQSVVTATINRSKELGNT